MEFLEVLKPYIYTEYAFGVVAFVEFIRWIVTGVDKVIKPRWLTLIVATFLGVAGYFFQDQDLDIVKAVTSFAFANVAYQYLWEPIKNKFFPTLVEKQKK